MRAVRSDGMTLRGRREALSQVEYRVRPVVRYVVTRYTPAFSPEPGAMNGPSLETLGEFDNEGYANEVCRVMGLEAFWASRRTGETGSGRDSAHD
jgi:hypothetical protein